MLIRTWVRGNRLTQLLTLVLVGVVIAASSGCASSSSEPAEESATASSEAGSDQSPATDDNDRPATDAGQEVVPRLADRAGLDFSDEAAVSAWYDDAEIEWRRLTAECMLTEGFEYSQQEWSSPGAFQPDTPRTSREFAETYGFGVVAAFLAATYDPTITYEAPNASYVESLTPAERDAYFVALLGSTDGENDSRTGLPTAGCAGAASAVSFALIDQFDQLTPHFEDYAVRFEADPRMVAINDQWASCMAEAGFAGVAQEQLVESFRNRLIAIFRSGDVFAYAPGDIPDLPEPDLPINGPSWRVLPELNNTGQAKVDELLADELATATASFDCRQETLEAVVELELEYEAEFVVEFESQIEEAFSS